jgi:hypothetical protein
MTIATQEYHPDDKHTGRYYPRRRHTKVLSNQSTKEQPNRTTNMWRN